MDDTRYHSREMRLESGDMLFLYTDGIVEAEDADGALYGKERLRGFLNVNANAVGAAAMPLNEMLPSLRSDIAAFAGGAEQSDDITMLAIRIHGGEEPLFRTITLKASIAELDALTAFIDAGLDAGGCPERLRGQIELAAEEVFVNIVDYAYNKDCNADQGDGAAQICGEVTVDWSLQPAPEKMTMTLIFRDRGRAFNPLEYNGPNTSLPLEEREPGGLGLLIVKKTTDTIQYSREGEVNRLEFSKSWRKEEQ
jgi:sigma-B regulation protein RsbU (phosphoserine phosphatase)